MEENRERLLLFLLFARMFPISPSWLLNVVAPFLNVPLHLFVLSAFLGTHPSSSRHTLTLPLLPPGLAPYNFVCVQAGVILSELRGWRDVFDTLTLIKLAGLAFVPLGLALWCPPTIPSHPLPSLWQDESLGLGRLA